VKHVPHVVIGAPWGGDTIETSVVQWRHLTKVLRMSRGDHVTYTDGLGTVGEGRLAHQGIERGDEHIKERPSSLTIAVAPPSNKDRQRFLVEKLSELGVQRLLWLETSHGKNRVTNASKVFSWVLAATEQSRGAWLMETSPDLVKLEDLTPGWIVCRPGGGEMPADIHTVVVGPEGGFAEDEIPQSALAWDLGSTILRVETAAVVAAARILGS
jgi:16S rRNA (uracil1498-N3)-methyltransferase